jgi:hypothetical protein
MPLLSPVSRRFRSWVFWSVLALTAALLAGVRSEARPQAVEVSADSILATARDLSGETGIGPNTRWAPLPSTAVYPRYLVKRLQAVLAPLGGTAVLDSFYPNLEYTGPEPTRSVYTDVVGMIPGALGDQSPGLFLVGAHLDGTSQNEILTNPEWDPFTAAAPGADDNGSGVGSILEAVRVLGERGIRPQADVMICFFDGEEQQPYLDMKTSSEHILMGSRFLADSVFAAGKLGNRELYGMLNLDMVSYNPRRDSLVVLTNIPSRWFANDLLAVRANGAAPGLQLERLVQGLTYSDHASFWAHGYDAVLLIEAPKIEEHNPFYHRETDIVANTYSRNGAMAAKASELVLGLFESWAETGPDSLTLTDEDILFQKNIPQSRIVDASQVTVGDSVDIVVGVTNRGGTRSTGFDVSFTLEHMDGRVIRELGTLPGPSLLPAGGRAKLSFLWMPTADEAGAVQVEARVVGAANSAVSQVGRRAVAVIGPRSGIAGAYVYPNPTRDPGSAKLHYELTRGGPVRLTLMEITGRVLGQRDYPYDSALPSTLVDPGPADVFLDALLHQKPLAPGLYLLRVELFLPDGSTSADVAVVKFAVLR